MLTFMYRRIRRTNGNRGVAVCMNLRRCCSRKNSPPGNEFTNIEANQNMKNPILILTLTAMPFSLFAADLSGTWKSDFDTQIGQQKYTYTLKQDGTNLTGK